MALVAFVVNRTLLHDPRRFVERCRVAADNQGLAPWFGPAGVVQDSLACGDYGRSRPGRVRLT